jgi:hypothetical protein
MTPHWINPYLVEKKKEIVSPSFIMKDSTQKTHILVRHVLLIAIDREKRYLHMGNLKSRPPYSIWILMFRIVKISARFLSFRVVERLVIVQSRAPFLQVAPIVYGVQRVERALLFAHLSHSKSAKMD